MPRIHPAPFISRPVSQPLPEGPQKSKPAHTQAALKMPESSMQAARPMKAIPLGERALLKELGALPQGPLQQAFLQATVAVAAPVLRAAQQALHAFAPAEAKAIESLFARAGQSPVASPRADAQAERNFLLGAMAEGAKVPALQRLAQQIRGTAVGGSGSGGASALLSPSALSLGATAPADTPVGAAVRQLKAAMDDQWGTDEGQVLRTLEGAAPADLPDIAKSYQKATGHSLQQSLALELQGEPLQRALGLLAKASAAGTSVAASPAAAVQAASTTAVSGTSVADIGRNLDAIAVTSKQLGTPARGNAVDLNLIIPINVAQWKPPKAKIYAPLKAAVAERNKAKAELDNAKTDSARSAAQTKLETADAKVTAQGEKVKAWMTEHVGANPQVRAADKQLTVAKATVDAIEKKHKKAKVPKDAVQAEALKTAQQAELDKAKATAIQAQTKAQTTRESVLSKIAAYLPMTQVTVTQSEVTIDGRAVRLHDGVETAYTNSWKAVDGGAVSGDSRQAVKSQLAKSGLSQTRQDILASISDLEGTFSKVNTWDTGRVSWGFTQWTLGADGNGTLASFMRDLKKTNPIQYQTSFGKFGLDIDAHGVVLTKPDGQVLRGVEAAEVIRSDVKLAAVFMAAGADPAMQQAQIVYANEGKITASRERAVEVNGKDSSGQPAKATLHVKDIVTSAYATALMTDLAVNAGSGAKVAAEAIAKYVKDKGVDPANVKDWSADAEKAVIASLESHSRDNRVKHHRAKGFSTEPNSFQ